MDTQAIALLIAAGGLVLGLARLAVSILSYRLDANRDKQAPADDEQAPTSSVAS